MESGVSAEVNFAQKLASNEKKIRDRAIKRLSRYLSVRSTHGTGLSEPDLLKIWKGLFYCMWMQDKPLIQEELSQRITSLVHCFSKTEDALRFAKVFLETQSREWNGIDRLRLDKFLMMVRGMIHETFTLLSKDDWQENHCRTFALSVYEHVMSAHEPRLPDGLKLHLADIFVEEMKKVSVEKLTNKTMLILLQPFIEFIVFTNKIELARRVLSEVMYKVLKAISASNQAFKAQSDTADDSSHGEEDMETDVSRPQKIAPQISFRLDKKLLLRLMFEMAGQKVVRASNRALIYNFVKKRSKILDSNASSKTGSEQTSSTQLDGDWKLVEQSFVCDLRFLKDDGKAADQQQKKKRKKQRKNTAEEVNITEVVSIETVAGEDELNTSTTKKKKKKRKPRNNENVACSPQVDAEKRTLKDNSLTPALNHNSGLELSHKLDSQTPILGDNKGLGNTLNNKKNKKKQNTPSLNKSPQVHNNVLHSGNRKRKLVSEDQDLLPTQKKSKVNSTDSEEEPNFSLDKSITKSKKKKKNSPLIGNKGVMLNGEEDHFTGDTNSNARPKYRSNSPPKSTPAVTPVELVIYTHSSPNAYIARQSAAANQLLEGYPPQPDDAELPTCGASDDRGRKRSKSESPKKVKLLDKNSPPSTSGFIGDLYSAMSVPFDMVMKDAGCVEAEEKSTPTGQALTSKKKVIFDLRRNKANKFQDYLKSLAKQPEQPFEPTKSPIAGILKSPGNSPALSPSLSEMSFSDSDSKPHRSKKVLGYGRRQSAPGHMVIKHGGKKNKS